MTALDTTEVGTAEPWRPTNDEYHADPAISNSRLNVFLEDPALYDGVFNRRKWPQPDGEHFHFGEAVHLSILEGRHVSEYAMEIPADVLAKNGAKSTNAYKEFAAANDTKILFKRHELETLWDVQAAIMRNEKARELLTADGPVERPFRWLDIPTGLRRRAKLDKLPESIECIVDLKSSRTAKPREFARIAFNLGYHRQAATYQDAVMAEYGEKLPFVFVVVKKTPPYTVEAIELDERFVELGRDENRKALDRLAVCCRTNNWNTPSHGTIITVEAPGEWAFSQDQWEYTE